MNFSLLNPPALEENCASLEPFLVRSEEAEMTEYVSSTPPLLSHSTGPALDIKTARKPLVLQPTTIRLNKVRPPPLIYKLKLNICQGLRNFDSPRTERIVLDFGSSDLVSSAVQ